MKSYVEKQALIFANAMIKDDSTIRQLSSISKTPISTVHYRLRVDLKVIDKDKWEKCNRILQRHKSERISRMNAARSSKNSL